MILRRLAAWFLCYALTVGAFALLTGCAPMSPTASYPPLPYSVSRIPDGEVYAKCARAWPLWQHLMMFPILPMGCAERYPQHGVCIIWVGETSAAWVVEHEKLHCAGHVH